MNMITRLLFRMCRRLCDRNSRRFRSDLYLFLFYVLSCIISTLLLFSFSVTSRYRRSLAL